MPRSLDAVAVGGSVVAIAAAISLIAGVLAGLLPAVRGSRAMPWAAARASLAGTGTQHQPPCTVHGS